MTPLSETSRAQFGIRFLFGNEAPAFGAFFRTALFRLALVYPFCIVLSNSLTDVWDLLLIVFWLLSGRWRERLRILGNSPILILSILLTAISFIGVFQYETTFLDSLRYWKGHHPIPILIVLSTVLTDRTRRARMLGTLGLAFLIGIGYSVCVLEPLGPDCLEHLKPAHIAKNYIWFGMALVLWAGLWICVPYVSRQNPYLRPLLSARTRRAMRSASVLSPWDLVRAPFISARRPSGRAWLFGLIRWGIVLFCIVYIFLFNPSRTAAMAILAGISVVMILWNWRLGLLYSVAFPVLIVSLAYCVSPIFKYRAEFTGREIDWIKNVFLDEKRDEPAFIEGRLILYYKMTREIVRSPLGVGMEKTRQKCLLHTGDEIDNLHNEFLAFASHSGFHGLACFLLWFFFLFRQSWGLPPPWKRLGIFVAVTLLADCLFNGALSQDTEGHLYCILIALIASVDAENRIKKHGRGLSAEKHTRIEKDI